jgi:hypothetical protein
MFTPFPSNLGESGPDRFSLLILILDRREPTGDKDGWSGADRTVTREVDLSRCGLGDVSPHNVVI